MVGCQSNDRVEGIQRVVNDQETLNSTRLDLTCLDLSPAGGLTVTTSRARTQTPQTPGSPDRRLTRPLSWHKLAVWMNVTPLSPHYCRLSVPVDTTSTTYSTSAVTTTSQRPRHQCCACYFIQHCTSPRQPDVCRIGWTTRYVCCRLSAV